MRVLGAIILVSATTEAFLPSATLPRKLGAAVAVEKHREAASARIRWATATATATTTPACRWRSKGLRMFEFEGGDGNGMGVEGEIDIEGKGEQGYTDVSVREAVEWTMSRDTEFTYIDVRSAEEHEKLATVRGALCIPAFEIITPEAPAASEEGEQGEEGGVPGGAEDTNFAPAYNYEDLDYTIKEDFVDTMKAQFDLDAKLLIGCKTDRSAKACELLVDAGFTQIFNVESQIFMRTRAPQVWS